MSDSGWSSFVSARCFDGKSAADVSNSSNCSETYPSNNVGSSSRVTKKAPILKGEGSRKGRKGITTTHSRSGKSHQPSRNSHTTPGAFLARASDRILFSVFEVSKDVNTKVGVCILNYNTGEMILSEFMDSQIYIRTIHKLQIHQPTEILLPHASLNAGVSKLASIIKFNTSESVKISETSNRFFNSQDGLNLISNYMVNEDHKNLKLEELTDKPFALKATAAALVYTEDVVYKSCAGDLVKFANFRVKYEATESTMLIDSKTIRGLELVENSIEKNGLSFWRFLDCTCTKMGRRLLRNSILQPLTDRDSIELRLEAVKELQVYPVVLDALRTELRCFQDLDRLLAKLLSINQSAIKSDQRINCSILLKSTLGTVKNIRKLMEDGNLTSKILIEAKDIFSCDSIEKLEILIDSYINEDCTWASSTLELENQRSYAVKKGANGLLEISRQVYTQVIDEIIRNIEVLSEEYEIPLDYAYDSNHGFHIKIKRNNVTGIAALPDIFINQSFKKSHVECSTLKIMKLNARLKEAMSEITLISGQMVSQLLSDVVAEISTLFMITEAISMLDLLCCFAHNAINRGYVIPQISDRMVFQQSRHPILETLVKDYVPNEISSTQHSSSVQIITGCNMSGKSVYLKQIALLCIMVQMGSAVPAKYASCKIYDKLHARVCNDSLEMCSSNFCYEMKEIAQFLDDIDSKTLIVLDELGRGSSIGDGFCISLAVTEYLMKTRCTVFLSTHFHDIPEILKYKPQVSLLNMRSEMQKDNTIKMYYQLSKESGQLANPGLKTIGRFFSPEIMKGAYDIAKQLRALKSKYSKTHDEANLDETKIRAVNQMKQIHNLVEVLRGISESDDVVSLGSLDALQEEFLHSFDL